MKQRSKRENFKYVISYIDASLLGNLLTGKGTIRVGESTIRAGQDF